MRANPDPLLLSKRQGSSFCQNSAGSSKYPWVAWLVKTKLGEGVLFAEMSISPGWMKWEIGVGQLSPLIMDPTE